MNPINRNRTCIGELMWVEEKGDNYFTEREKREQILAIREGIGEEGKE